MGINMKTILLVEDDEDHSMILKERLISSGYNVITSKTAKDAIDKLKVQTPDLVITDFNTPDGSGMDVLKHIKNASPNVPVIMLTAASLDFTIKKEASENGAKGFLEKPFDINKLKKIINEALSGREYSGIGR